jgi:hypothetical protein
MYKRKLYFFATSFAGALIVTLIATAMLGVLVEMNVAQIHLRVRGGRIELTHTGTCRILKIPRLLRPEALTPGVFGECLMLVNKRLMGSLQ